MIEVEMTSLEISELTGKKHKHVNETIKNRLLPTLEIGRDFDPSIFKVKTSSYKDKSNREQNMFILNKNAANALTAYYDITFACKLVDKLQKMESELEAKQRELDVMKSVVWEVINGQAYVSQEQALKCAGIKHPRLFMKYLKGHSKFYEDIMFNRHFLKLRQCNSHGDKWYKFTKEGFKWLLDKRGDINTWVDKCKQVEKEQKKMPF